MSPAEVLKGVALVVDGIHAFAPLLPVPVADKIRELKESLTGDAIARQDALADTLEAAKFPLPEGAGPSQPPSE